MIEKLLIHLDMVYKMRSGLSSRQYNPVFAQCIVNFLNEDNFLVEPFVVEAYDKFVGLGYKKNRSSIVSNLSRNGSNVKNLAKLIRETFGSKSDGVLTFEKDFLASDYTHALYPKSFVAYKNIKVVKEAIIESVHFTDEDNKFYVDGDAFMGVDF